MEKIKIEEIEARFERKKIRNIYITVNVLNGEVRISAPLKAARNTVESFFASKLAWIRKQREKAALRPSEINNNFCQGEKVAVLGRKYDLNIFEYAKAPKIFLNFDSIDMYISAKAGTQKRKEAMETFYRLKLEETVPCFVRKWEKKMGICGKPASGNFPPEIFRRNSGLLFPLKTEPERAVFANAVKIKYKKMKGRWGSCNISDRIITLNTELAKKSGRCIEYVTAHELLHLKERKHNKKFRDYMKKAFPDWKKLEAELAGYV